MIAWTGADFERWIGRDSTACVGTDKITRRHGMSLGPIELLIVKFPGSRFTGEIAPALKDLVESGTIRVIDILFVHKDEDGQVTVLEINDLDDDNFSRFDPVVEDLTGMLTPDDARQLSSGLDNNSAGAIMLFENTWAIRFRDAMENANGQLVLDERIPRAVIDELVAASEAA
jgi:hypothetical protein